MTRRSAAGAAVFVLFAVGSHALLLRDLPWRAVPGDDEASRAERRLAPLRAELPARGSVGYRAEPPIADAKAAAKRYYLAEYVLCPVVVEQGDRLPLVIDADDGARVSTAEAP
jgi:hypothetical protein